MAEWKATSRSRWDAGDYHVDQHSAEHFSVWHRGRSNIDHLIGVASDLERAKDIADERQRENGRGGT